jgi:DNA mismatch repair protein MutS2
MDEHTLKVLEFDKIVAKLQNQTACALGREVAGFTSPTDNLDLARHRQQETSEARSILQYEGNIPLGGIEDIRQQVERAALGALQNPVELLAVQGTLASARRLSQFLSKLREKYPLLGSLGAEIESFERVETAIAEAINQAGEVVNSASPALSRVRSELRAAHGRLIERMNSFLQSRDYRTAIQEPVITIRNDRYCIPVKAEYRGRIPGIVHDTSASGATLFVEPSVVVDLGNRYKELVVREREEVEKVLANLSAQVGSVAERIKVALNIIGLIDCITARAKLSIAQNATEPVLNADGYIDLRAARHPLLEGEVVPIDVALGKDFKALLITGPNTGGKTVSLKTIGLFSLMAAAGLHVPADPGTNIAVFEKVFADIGDEQSIEQSLSTFSSHMSNIVHITQNVTPNSLVLLDEIGAGTDPEEGAALAKAVLDYLLTRGARIVATTHYGELKEFAYLREDIENACVEFDLETLRPTYRLVIGIPGSSNAFAIAGRLGLDKSIVDAAQSNLARRAEATDELIRRIEETHRVAVEQRKLAERSSSSAEALRRRYEEQLARLEAARDRVESKVRERAESIIEAYTRKLDRTLEQLAAQKKDSKRAQDLKKKAERLVEQLERQVVEPAAKKQTREEYLPKETTLDRGTRVRIAGINQDGEIVEPPQDGKVVVLVGAMRVSVPISALRKPHGESEKNELRDESSYSAIVLEKARTLSPELHLRGLRVEAGLEAVEKYLDDAMAAGVEQVRIIHGKGTGQMRNAVHNFLKTHPGVSSYRLGEPEEGGSGATVVILKH